MGDSFLRMSRDELERRLRGTDPVGDARVVALDEPADDGLLDVVGDLPAVIVGLDVDAADDEVDAVARAVEANPDAAVLLATVLRRSEPRSTEEQLLVESLAYATLQGGPEHIRWLTGRERRDRLPPAEPVRIEREGDRLVITLADPDRRNAYSAAMRDALIEALAVAAADPSLAVELRGDGPSFCAGGDLDEFGTVPDPATAHRIRMARSGGRALAAVADRVTAHVHGACVGAGVELPAYAARVVAHPDTTFRLPEVAMGLVPGAGGTASLPRRVGRRRTALLALTGEPIDASTALAWGLVDELA